MPGKDHRTRVTKMLIRRAFTDLLRVKPVQSISIKELCEKAGVNRGTFYAHYSKRPRPARADGGRNARRDQRGACRASARGRRDVSSLRISTELFQCLKDNADLCTVTLGDFGDKSFAMRMLNMGWEKCFGAYSRYFRGASPKEIAYFYAFVSEGCIGLLRRWLREGMTTSAEDIAALAEKLMLQGASALAKAKT